MKYIKIYTLILATIYSLAIFAESGSCGENMTWDYNPKSGKLVISGTGRMYDFSLNGLAMWSNYRDEIKSVTFSEGITYLGNYAFYKCTKIKSVTLPKSITAIGASCFEGCTALANCKYKFLYRIGRCAFADCPNLKALFYSSGMTLIGEGVQHSSPKVNGFWISSNSKNYAMDEKSAIYTKDMHVLIQHPTGHVSSSYSVHPDATRIGAFAFADNTTLQNISIPDSVREIGEGAFEGCKKLESISIPVSVILIEKNAFKGCRRLKSIELPDSVAKIEDGTFALCDSLQDITLPAMLTEVGANAFAQCKQLQTIEFPARVQKIGKNSLTGCEALLSISYPHGMKFGDADLRSEVELNPYNSSFVKGEGFIVKRKDAQPPKLEIVPNSVRFVDATGNNRIDARERGSLRFSIKNAGAGGAYDCEARIALQGDTLGLHTANVALPDIPAGGIIEADIPVWSDGNTVDGTVTCVFEVFDPQGFGIQAQQKKVATHKFINPFIEINTYTTDAKSNIIPRRKPFKLTCTIKNVKEGVAHNINVELKLPYGVMVWEGETKHHFDLINGGESKKVTYSLIASKLAAQTLHFDIDLTESEGEFAKGKEIELVTK